MSQEDEAVTSATDSLDVPSADDEPTNEDATGGAADSDTGTPKLSLADLLEREGEVAADYLEGLLDIIDARRRGIPRGRPSARCLVRRG